MANPHIQNGEIHVNTLLRKTVDHSQQRLDPAIYERAVHYEPKNADYHFVLAQIYLSEPPFFNGGFESQPMNGGFDWRISSWENAEARRKVWLDSFSISEVTT